MAFLTSGPLYEACRRDFGGAEWQPPRAVVDCASEQQLLGALEACGGDQPRTVRGAGFSCKGQSLCPGGVVLVQCGEPDWQLLDDDTVEVSTRTRWLDLERGLNARGKGMPVLSSNLSATVGGTLSTGGFGICSLRHGAQTDGVLALRAPGGEWFPRDHAWSLRALGGLGQAGPIERVRLHVQSLQPWIETDVRVHEDLRSLARARPWDAPGLDGFFARSQRGRTVSVGIQHVAEPGIPRATMFPLEPMGAPHPSLRHVWCDYGVPPESLEAFLAFVDGRRGDISMVYVLALAAAPPERASNEIRPLQGPGFGVGLFCTLAAVDEAAVSRARSLQAEALQLCRTLGGQPYLWGAHEL